MALFVFLAAAAGARVVAADFDGIGVARGHEAEEERPLTFAPLCPFCRLPRGLKPVLRSLAPSLFAYPLAFAMSSGLVRILRGALRFGAGWFNWTVTLLRKMR